jgi:hypothetical protein
MSSEKKSSLIDKLIIIIIIAFGKQNLCRIGTMWCLFKLGTTGGISKLSLMHIKWVLILTKKRR